MTRDAICCCGKLTVRCTGTPELVSLCHCFDCQRRTGAPYGIAAFFLRENVRIDGRSRVFRRPSDSGFEVAFHFCETCGSTLFWEPARKPGVVGVAVGAFGDPGFPAPDQEVYTECRHGWVAPLAPEPGP
ncbi:MAG: GFA family protein [Rhodobacteraceae bacterium]|nr:GFA family protein [Paracoccaceae bacterium]MCP5323938.1 GFA family protein [Paracoccaceae bacterium]